MRCQKTPDKRKGTTGVTSAPSPSTGTPEGERLPFQELRGWRHPTTCSVWLSSIMMSVRISKILQAPLPSSSVEGEGSKSNPYKLCIRPLLPRPSPNKPQTPPTCWLPWAICSASQCLPLGIFLVKPDSSLSPPHPSACPSVPSSFLFLVIMSCAHHFSPFPDWKFLQASLTHICLQRDMSKTQL